jgi:TrmH family RNA methyltransferase
MVSKNEVKYIQSLYQKKNREAEQLFVAEGPKLVEELLQSNFAIQTIYATPEWLQQHTTAGRPLNIREVQPEELARISHLQTANQVLALVKQRPEGDLPSFKNQLSLVLDGIQDPGNLGTIIRIADWFGIRQVIASTDTVELYNPKVIQSTMGSFIRVQVWYTALEPVLSAAGIPVYGALLQGEAVHRCKKVTEGLLVIGNESKGIRAPLLPLVTHAVTIPRLGGAESLNAAVATGILLSHLVMD